MTSKTDRANIRLDNVLLRHIELIDQFQERRKDDQWKLSELKEIGAVIHMAVNDVRKVFPWDIKPEDLPVAIPDAPTPDQIREPIRKIKDLAGRVKINLG